MTRLHEGLDYVLYRIYVWGGLAAVVVYCLVVGIALDPHGQLGITVYTGPVTLYFAGILAYWWWVFLFKGNGDLEELVQQRAEGVPELAALKSWSSLHQAMAIHGGDVGELAREARATRYPVIIWYGGANVLVVWILGCLWTGWLGILPTRPHTDVPADPYFPIMVVGIFVWMALMAVGTPLLVGWALRGTEAAYLAPLGLALAEQPPAGSPDGERPAALEGASVMEGHRRGRPVRVEAAGRRSRTTVQASAPPFRVRSHDGRLVAGEGAPQGVIQALKGLRKAKRWKGVEVTGGAGMVVVERESRGENMWLYDLWLAECLLGRLDAG